MPGDIWKARKKAGAVIGVHHGGYGTPEYRTWSGMLQRCYDSSSVNFVGYGSRGITICDRWLKSFNNFRDDMGLRPSKKHSIERMDNSGPYSKENCRWATAKEQANNRRSSLNFTYKGVTGTIAELADVYHKPHTLIYERLQSGWSISDAIDVTILPLGVQLNKD